ncbi:glycosyltransferase family 9 protein [Brevibacterium renqingii]|uniref:glycosyltransferase family 9 protein n=1 Tax=Brevibacterium renqingii TaxID=2776916 RepID=UPI001ADF671B|nr:glycosyltransferase family 9 protein [Brevibacterium renqingii]
MVEDVFPDVERVAVVRGGGLGDLMFAYPALTALQAAYPHASITLIGSELHRRLLDGRSGPISEVCVAEPLLDGSEEQEAFFAQMRARGFGLAVQLHGGGKNSNPFLLRLGAEHTIGTKTPDAPDLERTLPYVYYQHEMLRALEVVGLAGASTARIEPVIAVEAAETAAAERIIGTGPQPLLIVHPGATDPRRRWPVEHFAQLTVAAVEDGWRVALVGAVEDVEDAQVIVDAARAGLAPELGDRVDSHAGRLSLAELLGAFTCAEVVVGNDSGPRHLAAAAGAKTVGIYWVGNALNAAPLSRRRHRVLMSWVTRCTVCGVDVTQVGWTAERCTHDPSLVAEVAPESVYDEIRALAAGH